MDYRFAIKCWQDKAGDENAKANVFVNGAQVVTEQEITKTSVDDPDYIFWESTGLAAPNNDGSVTVEIKVVMANEYYVDESNDRNIHIDQIGYIDKADGSNYIINKVPEYKEGEDNGTLETLSSFTDFAKYVNYGIPSAVVGDEIPSDFWSSRTSADDFITITVWGDPSGATITMPIKFSALGYVHTPA